MRPYYEDSRCRLYLGDAAEIVPELPDVDLAITDPPYGVRYVSNQFRPGRSWRQLLMTGGEYRRNPFGPVTGDDQFPSGLVELLRYKARSATLVFTPWRRFPVPPKSWIVWVKNAHTGGDLAHEYGRMYETIAFWPGPGHAWRNGRPVNVVHYPRVPQEHMVHPTEKPVGLLEVLIGHHAGGTLLDPFMGSGSTIRAAVNMGLYAIGVEIEERYAEVAARRMAQGVLAI